MKRHFLPIFTGTLLVAACSTTTRIEPRTYEVDGRPYCVLHQEELIPMTVRVAFGYAAGFPDRHPLKKNNYPNYQPWVNGGDVLSGNEPKEAQVLMCASCKQQFEELGSPEPLR